MKAQPLKFRTPGLTGRPSAYIIAIAALAATPYVSTTYSDSERAAAVPWALLDAFLLWRVWRGGKFAWTTFTALVIGSVALILFAWLMGLRMGDGHTWMAIQLMAAIAQLLLLTSERVRKWVGRRQGG